MYIEDNNQKFKYDESAWHLIAEYSLSDFRITEGAAGELTAGSFFQMIRELGLPPECIKRVEGTIKEATQGAKDDFYLGRPTLTVNICLFCQKDRMEAVLHSGNKKKEGWGYYVIERGGDLPGASRDRCPRAIELYLYHEGG